MAEIAVAQPSQSGVEAAAQSSRHPKTEKLLAAAFSIAVIGAMLSAVPQNWSARPRDSFPLSYFPMFSAGRADLQTEHYVVGLDDEGRRYIVNYNYIAPGGSLVRVRLETLRATMRRGEAAQLCENVSRRIADSKSRAVSGLASLEIVSGTFSLSEYLRGNWAPRTETVQATCAIRRQSA